MPGRSYVAGNQYRYGFNGKENDNEVTGDSYDFGNRLYNSRLGRWSSTDRVIKPWLSSFQFASGNPVNLTDPDGGDEIHFHYVTVMKSSTVVSRNSDGKYTQKLISTPVTYTYAQVIKDNNKDRFFVHRYDIGKSETIEFYPNSAERTKSGVTSTSYLGGLFSLADNDYESLQKISDDFTTLKNEVLGTEFESSNTTWSQSKENRNWWKNFYSNLAFKKKEEVEKAQANALLLGIVTGLGAEYLIGKVILAARGNVALTEKFFSTAIQKHKNGLTKLGHALQKHVSRPGSSFAEIKFSGKTADQDALDILDEILSSKNQLIQKAENGTTSIFDKLSGRGVNVSRSGEFNGFRDIKELKK